MRKERVRHTFNLERLLRDFAASPRGALLCTTIASSLCLTPEEAAALCRGECEEQTARRFRTHLLGCPSCTQQVAQVRGGGLPEELRDHPSEELLLFYMGNAIPVGDLGERLREEIAEHLQTCDRCCDLVEQTVLEIQHWSELQQAVEKIEWVRQLVLGVSALATTRRQSALQDEAQRAAHQGGLGKGVRRDGGEEVTAMVCDAEGKLILNQQGRPRTVRFTVLETRIDRQRGLFIQLLTADETCCRRERPFSTVQVSLSHGSQCLRFPPVEIRPGASSTPYLTGIATLRAKLGVEMDVRPIPAEALRLTVPS